MYGLGVLREAEGVAAGGRAEVYRHDDGERAGQLGSDLHPLRGREGKTHPTAFKSELASCSAIFSFLSLRGAFFYWKPQITIRSKCGCTFGA